jgi:hypothetical protein
MGQELVHEEVHEEQSVNLSEQNCDIGVTGRARSLLNLRPPFRKGESGNPGGRPKQMTILDCLRRELMQACPNAPEYTIKEGIVHKLCTLALDGDMRAINEIFDRLLGKPGVHLSLAHSESTDAEELVEELTHSWRVTPRS